MRVPRVRFTVRGMMVAVAVAGLGAAMFVEVARRPDRFRRLTYFHLRAQIVASDEYERLESDPTLIAYARRGVLQRRMQYHEALILKYTLAEDRPWLPVAPDPPEPE